MQFDFLEGKPFRQPEIDGAQRVAVISEDAKKQFFGDEPSVLGKYIETDNVSYRVIGVVRPIDLTKMYSFADIYAPYTAPNSNYKAKGYQGNYTAVLLAKSKEDVPKMEQEYQQIVSRIPPEDPKNFNMLYTHADTYTESFTRLIFGNKNDTGIRFVYMAIGLFVFLFLLLPTINLVNINISRIMERSSEIGVRKAFGASSSVLVGQFLFENVLLTLFGGFIGLILAAIVISVVNHSNLLPNSNLTLNWRVLLYGLLLCLLFGFFSGVLPAWRMSRLQVANALKSA
jgi:putative ABC transport system permease protein